MEAQNIMTVRFEKIRRDRNGNLTAERELWRGAIWIDEGGRGQVIGGWGNAAREYVESTGRDAAALEVGGIDVKEDRHGRPVAASVGLRRLLAA